MKTKTGLNKLYVIGISLAVLLFSFAFLASAVDNQTALQDELKNYLMENG